MVHLQDTFNYASSTNFIYFLLKANKNTNSEIYKKKKTGFYYENKVLKLLNWKTITYLSNLLSGYIENKVKTGIYMFKKNLYKTDRIIFKMIS